MSDFEEKKPVVNRSGETLLYSPPKVGDTKTIILPGDVDLVFCYIPAGAFFMGSPDTEGERYADECQHQVTLTEPFWMGKLQVTQVQWRSVVENLPAVGFEINPSPGRFEGSDQPVESVSWHDCREFLARLNAIGDGNRYALPTEAQWEYACRAGTTTPLPVGSPHGPNAWGLHDMRGRV